MASRSAIRAASASRFACLLVILAALAVSPSLCFSGGVCSQAPAVGFPRGARALSVLLEPPGPPLLGFFFCSCSASHSSLLFRCGGVADPILSSPPPFFALLLLPDGQTRAVRTEVIQ